MLATKDLGRRVRWTAAPGAQPLARRESIAEAKVRDLDAHLGVEE